MCVCPGTEPAPKAHLGNYVDGCSRWVPKNDDTCLKANSNNNNNNPTTTATRVVCPLKNIISYRLNMKRQQSVSPETEPTPYLEYTSSKSKTLLLFT